MTQNGKLYLTYDTASYLALVNNNVSFELVNESLEKGLQCEMTPSPERVPPPDSSQSYVFRPEKRIQIMVPKCYGLQLCSDYPDTELQPSAQEGAVEASVCARDIDIVKAQLKDL